MNSSILQRLNPDIADGVEAFLNRYNPELTVDMIHPQGIKFEDELGNKVVVLNAKMEDR